MVISVNKNGEGKIGTERSFRLKIEELNGVRYLSSANGDGRIVNRHELSDASEDALEKGVIENVKIILMVNGVMDETSLNVDPEFYKFLASECEKLSCLSIGMTKMIPIDNKGTFIIDGKEFSLKLRKRRHKPGEGFVDLVIIDGADVDIDNGEEPTQLSYCKPYYDGDEYWPTTVEKIGWVEDYKESQ